VTVETRFSELRPTDDAYTVDSVVGLTGILKSKEKKTNNA